MKSYLIKQVAEMAGVTVRTLHHYDQIGLLHPAYVGDNGYRYYTRKELLRLQQIMFFREMDMPLRDIQRVMAGTALDRLQRMRLQRGKLAKDVIRQQDLLTVIDRSIAELNGEIKMQIDDLYKGFSKEKQQAYEDELVAKHGAKMHDEIVASKAKLARDAKGDLQGLIGQRMEQLKQIEGDLVLMKQAGKSPDDPEVLSLIAQHHKWVGQWWDHTPDQNSYAGLADMYQHTPDFVARYETLDEGFADFLVTAMRAFAQQKL